MILTLEQENGPVGTSQCLLVLSLLQAWYCRIFFYHGDDGVAYIRTCFFSIFFAVEVYDSWLFSIFRSFFQAGGRREGGGGVTFLQFIPRTQSRRRLICVAGGGEGGSLGSREREYL